MIRTFTISRLALAVFAIICFTPAIGSAQDILTNPSGYAVKPGDVLQIWVWKEPELQRRVLVRPDGGISFPLAGEIETSSKTVRQIQIELKAKMTQYIRDADISVSLEEVGGNKIYVIGQVNRSGDYIMNPSIDVVQALSMAGGTTPFAALNDIRILRRTATGQNVIPFRFPDIARGKNLDQNIILESGDVVIVP